MNDVPSAPLAVGRASEQVLYDGPPQMPLRSILIDALLCLLVVGIFMLGWHLFIYGKRRFRITDQSIRYETGWIKRRIEIVELFKVRDVQFEALLGRGTIIVHSHDTTSPLLTVSIPDAQRVFDALQRAIPVARQQARMALHQDY
jgi:membrane protein YdbS with pleckstrin-like domain